MSTKTTLQSCCILQCCHIPLHFTEHTCLGLMGLPFLRPHYSVLTSFQCCLAPWFLGPSYICFVYLLIFLQCQSMYIFIHVCIIMGLTLKDFSRKGLTYDQTWSNKRITVGTALLSCVEAQERTKKKCSFGYLPSAVDHERNPCPSSSTDQGCYLF